MYVFTKSDEVWMEPGKYRAAVCDGVRSAVICCPSCGERGSLAGSHSIAPDGTVHPSVDCECGGFHEMTRLEGWAP